MTNDLVLLHGGTLGPWCWERLRQELESADVRVTAPDLPLSDTEAGFDACVRTVLEALPPDCEQPLVVAHSASGNYLPLAAKASRARKMVFLCAALPQEGTSWNEQVTDNPDAIVQPSPVPAIDDQGRLVFPPDAARDVFFEDCSVSEQEWAIQRMLPFAQTVPNETFPVGGFDGAPPAEYILGTLDGILNPVWHRREAEKLFDKPCIEIETGHSPFLADPGSLAKILFGL
jgi:pimeloyl-ACP methyl ester carboxylesterase